VPRTSKPALRAALLDRLEQELATAKQAHAAAIEGATHEEARPENDKDTRGLEQSYLARGLAQRVAELDAAVAVVGKMTLAAGALVAIGALVTVDEDDTERRFFVAPSGGGIEVSGVAVVTPSSPIGRALLGRSVDDECEVQAGARKRTFAIRSID
jgi:transcription elongation GreA/GreB family factor